MLIFNEGVPGSGKSYDAVLTHILPALTAGRHVYTNVNGLNAEKIAAHLDLDPEHVYERLHVMDNDAVSALPTLDVRDYLAVIDEAHEFYVSSRDPLAPSTENFFAKHRHKGVDIVLISQFYKRVHSAVRGRVERKYVFQKLSAVGLQKSYTVRQLATVGPEKWEEVDIRTKKYDPAIFPLYKSVEDGTANLSTYSQGSSTAWRKILIWSAVMVPMGIFSVYYLASFFTGDVEVVKQKKTPGVQQTSPQTIPNKASGPSSVLPGMGKDKAFDGPPAVAYVLEIANKARPRLAALMVGPSGKPAGIVEFFSAGGGVPLERLTLRQLGAMGFKIVAYEYGVALIHKGTTIVATNWPIDSPDANRRFADGRPGEPLATPSNQSPTSSGASSGSYASRPSFKYEPPESMATTARAESR